LHLDTSIAAVPTLSARNHFAIKNTHSRKTNDGKSTAVYCAMEHSETLEVVVEFVRRSIVSCPECDPSMMLSESERRRALAVKAAVEADNRIKNLSDFEYVQYALTCSGESLEMVCERVYLMEAFKKEYKLLDEALQGIKLFHGCVKHHPGFMLAIEYLARSDNYCAVSNYQAFNPDMAQTFEQTQAWLGGIFYQYQAQQPNFSAMRNGISVIVDCMGASPSNFNATLVEKYAVELRRAYPMNQREWYFINAGMIATLTCSMWKRFLPKRHLKTFHFANSAPGLEGKSLRSVYHTPNRDAAEKRMLMQVLKFLLLRYQNQHNFSLENAWVVERLP
jgi:CRAL/TRIO domain